MWAILVWCASGREERHLSTASISSFIEVSSSCSSFLIFSTRSTISLSTRVPYVFSRGHLNIRRHRNCNWLANIDLEWVLIPGGTDFLFLNWLLQTTLQLSIGTSVMKFGDGGRNTSCKWCWSSPTDITAFANTSTPALAIHEDLSWDRCW